MAIVETYKGGQPKPHGDYPAPSFDSTCTAVSIACRLQSACGMLGSIISQIAYMKNTPEPKSTENQEHKLGVYEALALLESQLVIVDQEITGLSQQIGRL